MAFLQDEIESFAFPWIVQSEKVSSHATQAAHLLQLKRQTVIEPSEDVVIATGAQDWVRMVRGSVPPTDYCNQNARIKGKAGGTVRSMHFLFNPHASGVNNARD